MSRRPRRGFSIDNVAMAALPLLLITFFMWKAHPKTWFNSSVELPKAHFNTIYDLEGNFATIILKNGKFVVSLESDIAKPALKEMAKRYGVKFSSSQVEKFGQMKVFNGSVTNLPDFIDQHPTFSEVIDWEYSIPVNSNRNELSDWIIVADKMTRSIHNKKLKIALLCDKNEPYSNIKLIRDALSKDSIRNIAIFYTPLPLN